MFRSYFFNVHANRSKLLTPTSKPGGKKEADVVSVLSGRKERKWPYRESMSGNAAVCLGVDASLLTDTRSYTLLYTLTVVSDSYVCLLCCHVVRVEIEETCKIVECVSQAHTLGSRWDDQYFQYGRHAYIRYCSRVVWQGVSYISRWQPHVFW